MDTSEDYIDMCLKAVEIQKSWRWEDGDFTHNIDSFQKRIHCFHIVEPTMRVCLKQKEYVWLPRIDQLCGMLEFGPPSQIHGLYDFMDDAYQEDDDGWYGAEELFDTWEQIWLAHVMLENYSKKWVNGEWKRITLED